MDSKIKSCTKYLFLLKLDLWKTKKAEISTLVLTCGVTKVVVKLYKDKMTKYLQPWTVYCMTLLGIFSHTLTAMSYKIPNLLDH